MKIDMAPVNQESFEESFGRRILEKDGFSFAQSNPAADYSRRAFDNVAIRQGTFGFGAILGLPPSKRREKIGIVPQPPRCCPLKPS